MDLQAAGDPTMPIDCWACSSPNQISAFCRSCETYMPDPTRNYRAVSATRRIAEYLADLVLFVLTLAIGWFVWLHFRASKGQTPGMRLFHVHLLREKTGKLSSEARIWAHTLLLYSFIGYLDGLFVLFDRNRRGLHDLLSGTIVVYASNGPPSAHELHLERGLCLGDEAKLEGSIEKWEAAIDHLTRSIDMNPNEDAVATAERGFAYAELGEKDRAVSDMRAAIRLTNDADLLTDLGGALTQLESKE